MPALGPAGFGHINVSTQTAMSVCAGYSLLTVVFVTMYLRARHHAARKEFHTSTPWHLGVHLLGNLGNLLLYPGVRQ